ncbi:hypothetical protein [Methylobacterium sp. 1030]|uniref:hypothetical protein n=1 Tax=Methylobacterium sp. 1030 TaxID=3156404 RepID=UPI00339B58BB
MTAQFPPIKEVIAGQSGFAPNVWARWFQFVSNAVNGRAPVQLQGFAKADVPDPARWEGSLIFVTDDVGGAVPAFSDGTNWRRVTDRAVIS